MVAELRSCFARVQTKRGIEAARTGAKLSGRELKLSPRREAISPPYTAMQNRPSSQESDAPPSMAPPTATATPHASDRTT